MEMRKGFENVINDMHKEFDYLLNFGFQISEETKSGGRACLGYKGIKFNLSLDYAFLEETFYFELIEKNNPSIFKTMWKVIEELDSTFEYKLSKPTLTEYKQQLHYIANKFKTILPLLLSNNYGLQQQLPNI